MRGQAAGNEKKSSEYFSAAVIGTVILTTLTWAALIFFDRQILKYLGTDALSVYGIIINISGLLIYLLPVVAGADSIWFAMPITELVVAVFVAVMMRRCQKQPIR